MNSPKQIINLPPGNIPKIDMFIDLVYTAKISVNVQSNENKNVLVSINS